MKSLIKNNFVPIIFAVVSIIIYWAIYYHFEIEGINTVLLAISIPAVIIAVINIPFISKRLIAIQDKYHERNLTEKFIVDQAKKRAKKEGKKWFAFGPKKQHTVWASTHKLANNIWVNKVEHLTKKFPKKEFYYIDSKTNNLKNGKQ